MRQIFFIMGIIFTGTTQLPAQTVKIATYNIFFLDEALTRERRANLQEVLQRLDADILAFQEIKNPAALRNILGDAYQIAMIDDAGEIQETALAARPPFRIDSLRYVFPGKYYDLEFPRGRDLLQVQVSGYGREFVFLVHHAKSRGGGRRATDGQREGAAKLMLNYIRTALAGKNVVLLGDFNDNPDDRSLNILEYGDSNAPGGIDSAEDAFLFNATENLLERDYCSYGYHEIYPGIASDTFALTVPGARAENNKWRGNDSYNFETDVKIKAILFDQILLSMNLKPFVAAAGVFNHAAAIRGERSEVRFSRSRPQYLKRGSLASDHAPVWVVLELSGQP